MDGWIGLSGCGCGGKVESGLSGYGCGKWKWKVERGAVPDLT